MIRYVCTSEDENIILSSLLSGRLDIYSSTLRKLKAGRGIYLNGQPVHVRRNVHEGDIVELDLDSAETPSQIPAEPWIPEIIFESPGLLAVNKPASSVVHPTCFHRTGTIASGVVNYYAQQGLNSGIHLVNRLDLGTSGLLLFAKYGLVQERMRKQAESGGYTKLYVGVLDISGGAVDIYPGKAGVINAPIARDRTSIIKRKVSEDGDSALTKYKIIAVDNARNRALAAFSLVTGRTHQIRVHMSYAGFPLAGDSMYNPAFYENETSHQLLHQYRATFTEPLTHERITLCCPVPEDISSEFPELFTDGRLTEQAENYLAAGEPF
ncbi:MAG: RluA family pseudouridine synthase [Clostridia bacterium]|nr:RluA family pseudouridine synthase [Clostridia bacterium]